MSNRIFPSARFLVCLVCLAASAMSLHAELSLSRIHEKANRFYRHEEWANAVAMFRAILQREPTDVATYGRSVVVYGVIGDQEEQISLLEDTQKYALPLDRLFDAVRTSAYEIGRPEQLVSFMDLVKVKQPWLKRNINIRLARYYDSRNNAEKMIEMSDTLLAVNPDDPSMLKIKARGYLLLDRYDDAMPLYRRIVDLNPSDYDSLLTLGVYYYEEMDRRSLSLQSASAQSARKYLAKANALRPTERVEAMLARLNPTTEK